MGIREGSSAAGNVTETTEKNSQEKYSADNLMLYRVSLSLIDSLHEIDYLESDYHKRHSQTSCFQEFRAEPYRFRIVDKGIYDRLCKYE